MAIKSGWIQIKGWFRKDFSFLNPFHGEAAQGFSRMAPGIEIPVIPVQDESLRGDLAPGRAACRPPRVAELQTAAVERSPGHNWKTGAAAASALLEQADAFGKGFTADSGGVNKLLKAQFQWGNGGGEETRFQVFEDVVADQQGAQFIRRKPKAGEFVLAGWVGMVEKVPPPFLVVNDRFTKVQPKVADYPFCSRS